MLTNLWIAGGGDKPTLRVWTLPRICSEFQERFDKIQEELVDLRGMDDLLTGVLSKSKGQILRLTAIFNALFSIDPAHPLSPNLCSASVKAAINFVEVCNEHTATIGGKKNFTSGFSCEIPKLFAKCCNLCNEIYYFLNLCSLSVI